MKIYQIPILAIILSLFCPVAQAQETTVTNRYGMKVWESYLENNTPGVGRIFWVYGPRQGDITLIGLEPHPNDKSNAYRKITLSSMGNGISD